MQNILIALSSLGDGGISSMMKQYVLHIDRESFQIDFLVYEGSDLSNQSYFEEKGCRIFVVPDPKKHYFKARRRILAILKEGQYDVLHSCNFFNSGFLMKFAKEAGVKGRLVHSHASHSYGSGTMYRMYEKIMRKWILKYGNVFLACSTKAGAYLFPNVSYVVLPNAVNAERFEYDARQRESIRQQYHIEDNEVLLGSVAMLSKVKNQVFLIEILKQLPQSYRLMLVGDGDQREVLERKAKEEGVFDRMIITGWTSEAYRYYSAFDRFVLPSFSEGFPVVSLEAQANGLYCYLADTITEEVRAGERVEFLPLNHVDEWVSALMHQGEDVRINALVNTVFDMKMNIHELEEIYRMADSLE